MRGVPIRTIQELAGHAGIMTTMKYMHLTQSAVDEAVRVLESGTWQRCGNKRGPRDKPKQCHQVMAEAHGNRSIDSHQQ